jgi:hypothetical protein
VGITQRTAMESLGRPRRIDVPNERLTLNSDLTESQSLVNMKMKIDCKIG